MFKIGDEVRIKDSYNPRYSHGIVVGHKDRTYVSVRWSIEDWLCIEDWNKNSLESVYGPNDLIKKLL